MAGAVLFGSTGRSVWRARGRVVGVLAGCAVVAAAGALLGVPGSARATPVVPVPGSAFPAVHTVVDTGAVAASQPLTIQVWLRPNLAGATAFADAVTAPGNAEFHHFLSPDAYTARFGPSAAQAAAVASWLTASGLTRVRASSGRDYVSATGPVSTVQTAFHVRINNYRVSSATGTPTTIQSNDRDVSVPAALAPDVLGITGLTTVPPIVPRATLPPTSATARTTATVSNCVQYWGQQVRTFHPAYHGLTEGGLPVCGYSADQIRAAYGATWTDTGAGQTVALTEDETPDAMFQTLTDYAKHNHLPAPKPTQFREQQVGGGGTCTAPSHDSAHDLAQPAVSDEQEMDSEAVYAMAPNASQLMVIGSGCDENQALLNATDAVLTGDGHHPSASIVSNSWQIPTGSVSMQTVHAMDLRAAGEGVGMYFASGDTPGLTATDDDPYVTAVGGTTLGMGAKDNRLFETGWSDDNGFAADGTWTDQGIGDGSGGGTSVVYGQPAYQKGVVPASMSQVRIGTRTAVDRAVPDLAADGDPDTGMLTGYRQSLGNGKPGPYQTVVNAGTSLACPLVAGLVADAQQGQPTPFGFINPLLYRLTGTTAFHDALPVTASTPSPDRAAYLPPSGSDDSAEVDVFDAQQRPDTQQVTATGYDTMTGLGTPNGPAFIAGLRHALR